MSPARLIFVTGKGGTGKSTVAAALGLALAQARPTVLAELDRRRPAARLLGATLDDGGTAVIAPNLEAVGLSPHAELEAFIGRIVPVRAISRRMLKSRTFGYVTAALPGMEAFLMLGRLRLMAGKAALEDRYVVVDGPGAGSALELLSVAGGIRNLAPLGTLNRLATEVEDFLVDRARFQVLVTLKPEQLALNEALETVDVLRKQLHIERIDAVLNGVPQELFTPAEMAAIGPLREHAELAARRAAISRFAVRARRELTRAGLGVIELPMLFRSALGPVELKTLAGELAAGLRDL